MTAPVIQSVQYSGSTLYLIFDRAVANVSDLSAFTFTVTPGPTVITPTFSLIDENAVVGTLLAPIGPSETLTVDYADPGPGVTQVQEAAAPNDPLASFTGEQGVTYYSASLVRRARVAADGVNDQITIYFGEPVGATSADLLAGLTIEYNDVAVDLSSATASLNADQTELVIDTGANPLYSDVVDVIYDGLGQLYTWPGGSLPAFTLNAIDNDSTDGLPTSAYPQSFVIKKELSLEGSVVTARLDVVLNPIDRQIVSEYGPVTVYTGGTFGVTVDNPSGLVVIGGDPNVVDGTILSQTFTSAVNTKFATDAAADWQSVVTARLGIALGQARAMAQSITITGDTVESV